MSHARDPEYKSNLLKPAIYDCPFGTGKCELMEIPNSEIDCIYKNDSWCPYRELPDPTTK
jgi:hypothetical protein